MSRRLRLVAIVAAACLPACEFDPRGLDPGRPGGDGGVVRDGAPLDQLDGRPGDAGPDAGPDGRDDDDCPADYVPGPDGPGRGSSYRYIQAGAGWLTAEADCEDDGEGTHLVTIEDAAELA